MSRGRKILIIVFVCVVLLLAVCVFALLRRDTNQPAPAPTQETTQTLSGETEPQDQTIPTGTQETTATTQEQESTKPTDETKKDPVKEQEEIVKPDTGATDAPPVVVIPDPEPEKQGLQFPCEVPGHNLKIEKLAPYSGMFVENGTNTQVTGVAMILISNTGEEAVEYTQITVKYAETTLTFQITALPAGERMVVQELNAQAIPEGEPVEASALVVHRAQMAIAPELSVKDNGDNTLTVTNLTDKTIPMVRVFYKYYMENEDIFVGGIAFTVKITNLPAKGNMVVQPAHFVSANSRVVMALTYDSEI